MSGMVQLVIYYDESSRFDNKVKNFSIFEGVIPLSQFGIVNQMWCVCVPFCVICKIL